MIEASVSEIKAGLSAYINRAAYGNERIIIVSRGKPKAAMIGIEELERLEALEDAVAAQEAVAAYEAGETQGWEQFKAELERLPNAL